MKTPQFIRGLLAKEVVVLPLAPTFIAIVVASSTQWKTFFIIVIAVYLLSVALIYQLLKHKTS